MQKTQFYHELHRPQFHFSPQKNWTNDPNGLIFYKGEYHLFFQHNPERINWGNMTWGHAVSPDLVHWTQLDHALYPDELGTIFSGSAVVDWDNTAGFQTGDEKVIVCIYTSAGEPFTQSIAYSNDRGRTFTKYEGNPVLGHIRGSNRDPKVIWHKPTQKWVMALYLDGNDYALFGSKDLKKWGRLCDVVVADTGECPDFFELPVDDDPDNTRWVFWGGAGVYRIGTFDGTTFAPETESLHAERGANGYAAQTWSDILPADGRRIQVSWMAGGKYPSMPFNHQMSFPVELTLRAFPEGIRMCRQPVREIESLHGKAHTWENHTIRPNENLVPETDWDLFDVRAEVELGDAEAFGAIIRGIDLKYHAAERKFTYLGRDIPAEPVDGRLEFRVLVDRTSLELFANSGKSSASFCFLPEARDAPLEFYAVGECAKLSSLVIHELRSIWP